MEKNELPPIEILMAVYDPRRDWLIEQLRSLNTQSYPRLLLRILDDASPNMPFEELQALVRTYITAFPYTIERNERNLGSNLSFEKLTASSSAPLLAYCDQDDIWLPDKLLVLREAMEREGALLVCSDMFVIDENGTELADRIRKVRRHQHLQSGTGLAEGLLTRNFVTGCTMLVRGERAREAVPFCPYMVHDQYLALFCAERGAIFSVREPQIRYRIHGGNQTATMSGVTDKASYGRVRIETSIERLRWLREHFPCGETTQKAIERRLSWAELRRTYWTEDRGALALWRLRDCGRTITLFELAAKHFPERLFRFVITLAKKNVI